jgi:hypothetical protein
MIDEPAIRRPQSAVSLAARQFDLR